MDQKKLSEIYSVATQRMHDVIDEFYEDLHKNDGSPKGIEAEVLLQTAKVVKVLRSEIDLIKSAVSEYYELNSR
jgi:hypothetical protein